MNQCSNLEKSFKFVVLSDFGERGKIFWAPVWSVFYKPIIQQSFEYKKTKTINKKHHCTLPEVSIQDFYKFIHEYEALAWKNSHCHSLNKYLQDLLIGVQAYSMNTGVV